MLLSLRSCCSRDGSATGARDVDTGSCVVVLGEAIGAEVKLVDAAHDCRRLNPAQIASATRFGLGLRSGWYCRVKRTRSQIEP